MPSTYEVVTLLDGVVLLLLHIGFGLCHAEAQDLLLGPVLIPKSLLREQTQCTASLHGRSSHASCSPPSTDLSLPGSPLPPAPLGSFLSQRTLILSPSDSSFPRSSLGNPGAGPPASSPAHGKEMANGFLLIVSMGDDFQGEISSSVESLSFKAMSKMSPPH